MKTFPEPSGSTAVLSTTGSADASIIHLAMAFDEAYVSPFTVLLTSIFHNNKNNKLHFHVITSGVGQATRNDLAAYCSRSNSEISFYSVTPDLLNGLVLHPSNHLSIASYYRLFFANLVPKTVSKLLYLDTDMLVLGDLANMYSIDLGQYAVGAVAELDNPLIRTDLGFTEPDVYFNSGVLLINVQEWNKQKITQRAVQFTVENPEKIIWADQDALNGILIGDYYRLPPKYNILHLNVPRGLSRQGYEDFISDKVIP
ncbi:MAG: glycosyltransferase family 8 protein [Sphingobacteriales bacterium]|nr:MAG: glycosyltransferase family 8 protein [Sphingobacteriales bacterium]